MAEYRSVEIQLTRGAVALVDEADAAATACHRWHLHHTGYAARTVYAPKRSLVLMHRALMGAADGTLVDHVNGNKTDNRRVNLRLCTHATNAANSQKRASGSRYKGVVARARTSRFEAVIRIGGRRVTLGWFDVEDDAAAAYNEAARTEYGEYARLNVLETRDA